MGKPCFSKVIKFFVVALLGAAAAITAIAVLSSPATAGTTGGGGGDPLFAWDTDNLRYQSYNAMSFNIPFHDYSGYSGVAACQKNVADSFFQTDNSVVNDFPRLVPSGNANGASWSVAGGSAGNDAGCDTFVAQQDRLAAQVAAGVGYALDESGNLAVAPSGAAYTTGRSAADLSYVVWTAKAASGYTLTKADNFQTINTIGATSDPSYLRRVDGRPDPADPTANLRAISPSTATWTVPSAESSRTGNFGASWHGTKLITDVSVPSYYDPDLGRWVEGSTVTRYSDVRVSSQGNLSRHLTAAKSADLCPSLFHPRGEDSINRIGRSTGRTLSGLSHPNGQTADRYWCRSDVRYERRFGVETHTLPAGIIAYPDAPASGTFTAYGRLGCYYTATGQTPIASTTARKCGYMFPLPRCDSDKDGTADREYTAAEVQALRDKGTIAVGQPFTIAENARCAPAAATPTQAGFTADPCVTASLEIYENRTAGSDAEPGVAASERTLAVAAGRTAFDLDVTSPHPLTASPPKDTSDASGCADGSENRADHAASSGDAARSQTVAPSYASSARTDTAAPPNDADGDIDYTGAVKNMAHRYASRVAENTCAAKRAEARLRVALLEAEAELYKDWMSRYSAWAKGRKDAYNIWRPNGYPSGVIDASPLSHATFYSFVHAKRSQARLNYATGMSAMYAALQSAASTAAGTSLAAPSVSSSWCGDPSSFVSSYSASVTALKNSAVAALTASRAPTLASVNSQYSVTSPSQGTTTATTAGTAAVYENQTRTRYRTVRYRDCGYHILPDQWHLISDDWICEPGIKTKRVSYTTTVRVLTQAEVKATASYSYPSYRLVLSGGGGWSGEKIISAATRGATCRTWRTSSCPSAGTHPGHSYSDLLGTSPGAAAFPSTAGAPSLSVGSPGLSLLLGKYNPSHTDRADLKHSAARTRDQEAIDLGELEKTTAGTITPTAFSNLAVPPANPAADGTETTQRNSVKTAAQTYQNAYTGAYDDAYDQATGDMGTTATTSTWNRFDWRYETSTLAWGSYQEDPATTYSGWVAQTGETEADRDGTGCDLIAVASDGTVSVEATRLDYETSKYGKGSVYSTRTDAQRTCKIRRTRTPELLLEYQPTAPSGTDTSKAAAFWHVNYQPTSAAERFKLYDEAEVFAVKTSLADSPPVFCASNVPSTMYVSHAAGAMSDMSAAIAAGRLYSRISTDVLRPAGYSAGRPQTDHCFSGAFANAANVKIAVFDDTAHSAMNLVYLEKDPADTSGITLLASGGALTADPAVAYPGDSAQNGSFYGTTYSMPI